MDTSIFPLYVRVALALLDYVIKAAANYKDTEQGAREWADVTGLFEQDINQDANSNVTFGMEDASQSDMNARRSPVRRVVNSDNSTSAQ